MLSGITCYLRTKNRCHPALSAIPVILAFGLRPLQVGSVAIAGHVVAYVQLFIPLAGLPVAIVTPAQSGSPNLHHSITVRFVADSGAVFHGDQTGGIAMFGLEITSFR